MTFLNTVSKVAMQKGEADPSVIVGSLESTSKTMFWNAEKSTEIIVVNFGFLLY